MVLLIHYLRGKYSQYRPKTLSQYKHDKTYVLP